MAKPRALAPERPNLHHGAVRSPTGGGGRIQMIRTKAVVQIFALLAAALLVRSAFLLVAVENSHRDEAVRDKNETGSGVSGSAPTPAAGRLRSATIGSARTTAALEQQEPSVAPTTTLGADAGGKPSKPTSDHDHEQHVHDVLIVGAGWSGLGAAQTLTDAGIADIAILEARDYVGGRSHTVYPFSHDLAVELGSAWVYDGMVPHRIAKENRIRFGATNNDAESAFGLYHAGRFVSDGASTDGDDEKLDVVAGEVPIDERRRLMNKVWQEDFVKFSKRMQRKAETSNKDVPYRTVVDAYLKKRRLPMKSKSRQLVHAMLSAQVQVEYGVSLNEMSTAYIGSIIDSSFLFAKRWNYVAVKGGGFDKILAPLAEPLKDKIQLQSVVTKIEYGDDRPYAKVTYKKSSPARDGEGGTKVYTKLARRVLVTVPLGVLKTQSIDFVPPLPSWKQDAIDLIGVGVLNKCIFYWDTNSVDRSSMNSWWPNGKQYMSLIADDESKSGKWTTFFNDREMNDDGDDFVLSSWIGGDDAKEMERTSDESITGLVLANLRAMYGERVPEPTKVVVSRWGQDEFARGSYSYCGLGGQDVIGPAREQLAEPVGERLFWAGEATTTNYGTTHGAFQSGVRMAEKIRKSIAQEEGHSR